MFCVWLVLPMFNGAAYIYENYVRQYIKNIGTSNYSDEYKKVLHMMTFDARKAVERYNDRYGPDAFDRVVRAVWYKTMNCFILKLIYISVFLTFFFVNFHMIRLKKKQRSDEWVTIDLTKLEWNERQHCEIHTSFFVYFNMKETEESQNYCLIKLNGCDYMLHIFYVYLPWIKNVRKSIRSSLI